ncbi:TenA family protein [Roseomonas sp. GC11]|uniref:TenA family protein n=1 Tax=Roseomonas sp. GC11 TaxID=2950546 RepID=UPI00210A95A4|nr:TenA family protein [Roseomonas sp. GC11]MCQ4159726.1 TenA family protein [Roseomonas sp. GC11]
MSLSDRLRAAHAADWDAAITHRFVAELCAGRVAPEVLRAYLVQDYQFIDRFVALLGAAIASADSFAARLRLSRFLAMITSDENTYFQRAFDELGVPEAERRAPALTATTRAFQALMREAAESRSYAQALAVLAVAEWLYLSWAERHQGPLPERFIHAEWITLHDNDDFRGFVGWLRAELDRVGPAEEAACAALFGRAVALERRFFDDLYEG